MAEEKIEFAQITTLPFTEALFSYKNKHPYYIYAPPIKLHSAGIATLHRLCHLLNMKGHPAFIVADRRLCGIEGYPRNSVHPSLITPELTTEIARAHFASGLSPIAIYSDTVYGDPLEVPVRVRYLLNYPGALGGPSEFPPEEIVYSYSQKIAEKTSSVDNSLFIPVSDPFLFSPGDKKYERQGRALYAAKHLYFHKGRLGPEASGAFEITRDHSTSLTKPELAELFRRSEAVLCYENTAIAIEAVLCGCPAIFVPTEYFTEVIGEHELGWDGFAWGLDPAELERAKSSVGKFRERYFKLIADLDGRINQFIDQTQARARSVPYKSCMNLSALPVMVGLELARVNRALDYMSDLRFKFRYYGGKKIGIELANRFGRKLGLRRLRSKASSLLSIKR